MKPPFPSFDFSTDVVDDEDDCIICGKLLLKHSEIEANQCYKKLNQLRNKKEVKMEF